MEQPPVFLHLSKAENANLAAIAFLAFASVLLVKTQASISAGRRAARSHEFDLRQRAASLDEREELIQEQAAKGEVKGQAAKGAKAPRGRAHTEE